MSIFYCADLHHNHVKVSELRGFNSVEEHNDTIERNWRAVVKPTDIVWVLGDLTLAKPGPTLEWLSDFPGIKHLIAGNHDAVSPIHRKGHTWQKRYLEVFESVSAYARRKTDSVEFLLSHYPYSVDHTTDVRYSQYRLRDEGMNLVCGHTHSSVVALSDREYNVCLDAHNMTPVAETKIVEFFKAKRDVP